MPGAQIIVPTHYAPLVPIELCDGIVLSKGNLIELSHTLSGGSSYKSSRDSLIVSIPDSRGLRSQQFKDWVLFHSLIFNTGEIHLAFDYFQWGYSYQQIRVISGEPHSSQDYCDIAEPMYWSVFGRGEKPQISYEELYRVFLEAAEQYKVYFRNLIYSILGNELADGQLGRKIIDDRVWRLLCAYSVVESLIKDQPSTCIPGAVQCPNCKKPTNHKPLPDSQWMRQRLEELGVSTNKIDEYLSVITSTKNALRNPVAHGSYHPSIPDFVFQEGDFEYPLVASRELVEDDSTALDSMINNIYEIGRYLLFSELFDIKIYPQIHSLRMRGISF